MPRASEIADELTAEVGGQATYLNVWERGTKVELSVATGDETTAVEVAKSLAEADRATPFELQSLRRQLIEVWELPADDPVLIALTASEVDNGAGAEVDVPSAGSLEKILAEALPVGYENLVRGLEVARMVCRIVDAYDEALGTGFVLPGSSLCSAWSDDLVLVTNAHVIPMGVSAGRAKAVFTKLPAGDGSDAPVLDDLKVRWSSAVGELDATILTFDQSLLTITDENIRVAGALPSMGDRDPFVYVVGHPQGRPLALSLRGNELLGVSERLLHYMAPTEPGSSGSPVFDPKWNLIGLHHAGSMRMPRIGRPDERYPANEAINIHAIRAALAREFG